MTARSSATARAASLGCVAAVIAALVEQATEAAEAALLGTRIFADGNADANSLADRVGFANRHLLADGDRNLFDNFLLLVANSRHLLLFDNFLGYLLGNLHLANFFARLPNLHFISAAWNGFLNIGVFREEISESAEVALLGTRIIAFVGTRIVTHANLLANSLASISTLFVDPGTCANFDFLLFPNGFANDLLAVNRLGFVDRLADDLTAFLHDRFGHVLVNSAGPLFGHSLPFAFVANGGGSVAGVCSRGTSHDGRSATATATASRSCGIGTEYSQDGCDGRG
jgi:hypothetical protein